MKNKNFIKTNSPCFKVLCDPGVIAMLFCSITGCAIVAQKAKKLQKKMRYNGA